MAKHLVSPTRISPISIGRIVDTAALVSISFIASYILFTGRSNNPLIPAILFAVFMAVIMLSIHARARSKEDAKITKIANRLWLENAVTQGSQEDFTWLVTDALEHEGFMYQPDVNDEMHFSREGISYLTIPKRMHPTYSLTAQDVMNICDEAKDNLSRSLIIFCSCTVDEGAYEFAEKHPVQRVFIYEMQDIAEINLEMGNYAPYQELENYCEVARYTLKAEQKTKGSKKAFPPLRYLLTAIMLSIGAVFVPYKQWYIIMGGISLALFFAFLIFPRLRMMSKQSKAQ